jgi:hypothetical protein
MHNNKHDIHKEDEPTIGNRNHWMQKIFVVCSVWSTLFSDKANLPNWNWIQPNCAPLDGSRCVDAITCFLVQFKLG